MAACGRCLGDEDRGARFTLKNGRATLPQRAATRVECVLKMRWGWCLPGIAALAVVEGGCGRWADKLACGDNGCLWTSDEWARVVSIAGLPDQPPPPDPSNKYVQDPAAAELGHKLYFDTRLSGAATWVDSLGRPAASSRTEKKGDPVNISCATCHDPARYGSDFTSMPRNVSIGAGWYDVNIQQTLNVGFFSVLYWNGRTDSVWAQAAQVIESGVSMNGDRLNTFWVVVNNYRDDYTSIFCPASDPPPDGCLPPGQDLTTARFPLHGKPGTATNVTAFDMMAADDRATVTRVHVNVSKAIAAYERLLRSGESAFDRFVKSGADSTELTPAAQRGLKLFVGRASCIDCHNTPLLSDQKFHNIGIPQSGAAVPTEPECNGTASAPACDCTGANAGTKDDTCLPWGAYAGALKRRGQKFCRQSPYSDSVVANAGTNPSCDTDVGSDGGTERAPNTNLKHAWRTPSLRDVAMTAPYMHDGVFATLSDVVWHYDQAETATTGSELSPLNLSARDREDLVAFLESLTGQSGATDLTTKPPLPGTDGGLPAADAGADTLSGTDAGSGNDL